MSNKNPLSRPRRRLLSWTSLAAGALAGVAPAARAQEYPSRPIRLIVPFSTGGAVDLLARSLAQPLSARLGASIIVDNRPGANGVIGTQMVVQAPADGYTILFCYDGTLVINPAVGKVPFDTLKDLAPVTRLVNSPIIFAVSSAVPARNFAELQALAKRSPVTYGSSGTGSTPHMFGELVKLRTGIDWSHVPYKGAGPAVIDVLAGSITGVMTTVSTVEKYLKSGQMRGILISGSKRNENAPDTATVTELGHADADADTWFGVLAPAATPRPIIDRLHRETVAALRAPELAERLATLGFSAVGNSPEAFREDIRNDLARWAKVAREANIRLE
jgi:tripartite-type tricarboxylate transporter receptor subunit TctC